MRGVRELPELARDQERDLLADVDGVVAHAFESARSEVHVHPPLERLRVVGELGHLEMHVAVEAVDRIVHLREPHAELQVSAPQRVHRDTHHLDHDVAHLADLLQDRRVGRQILGHLVHLRDVHGLVPDAFQVQARMHDHRDQSQVRRDRSLQRQEREQPAVELEVDLVDLVVARDDPSGPCVVVLEDRLDRVLDRVARELAEREQSQLRLLERLVEVGTRHQPNLPVT
jgi:hypothetical protein